MKFWISYFYQVRFLPPQAIPVSTAIWDPKWFHDGRGRKYTWVDKRGVINGLRVPFLAPGAECNGVCSKGCREQPPDCQFLKRYKEQLDGLEFTVLIELLEDLATDVKRLLGWDGEPEIVLLVHEAPENQCSERVAIQQWFMDNNRSLEEWHR